MSLPRLRGKTHLPFWQVVSLVQNKQQLQHLPFPAVKSCCDYRNPPAVLLGCQEHKEPPAAILEACETALINSQEDKSASKEVSTPVSFGVLTKLAEAHPASPLLADKPSVASVPTQLHPESSLEDLSPTTDVLPLCCTRPSFKTQRDTGSQSLHSPPPRLHNTRLQAQLLHLIWQ